MEHQDATIRVAPMAWTAIATSSTPADQFALIVRLANHLSGQGWCLRLPRSGGQQGLFLAEAAGENCRFYLPQGRPTNERELRIQELAAMPRAVEMAASLFADWEDCNDFSRRARLSVLFALLGDELNDPARFLILYRFWAEAEGGAEEGAGRGLEGAALAVAAHGRIQVLNLAEPATRTQVRQRLEELGV